MKYVRQVRLCVYLFVQHAVDNTHRCPSPKSSFGISLFSFILLIHVSPTVQKYRNILTISGHTDLAMYILYARHKEHDAITQQSAECLTGTQKCGI